MRKRTELENGVSSNEESIDNLDKQLSESKVTLFMLCSAQRKTNKNKNMYLGDPG